MTYLYELEDSSVRAMQDGIRYARERADREGKSCAVWLCPSGRVFVRLETEDCPVPGADKVKVVPPNRS